MVACNDKNLNQRWTLSPGGELRHNNTGLCLDMGAGSPGQEISVEKCDGSARQVWRPMVGLCWLRRSQPIYPCSLC